MLPEAEFLIWETVIFRMIPFFVIQMFALLPNIMLKYNTVFCVELLDVYRMQWVAASVTINNNDRLGSDAGSAAKIDNTNSTAENRTGSTPLQPLSPRCWLTMFFKHLPSSKDMSCRLLLQTAVWCVSLTLNRSCCPSTSSAHTVPVLHPTEKCHQPSVTTNYTRDRK